ncbi:pentapeptide repeat-containing protein [uncultured Cellulomonas sp.]|uniref:pentapeptide repeat-containing protein n=1 Tax=uncultured Cellulomonas sp. TaxID=189682 RepID=UPI0026267E2E|nr:pentapeptide repeat-containing protein [uncultured Cellulomonas sp.]
MSQAPDMSQVPATPPGPGRRHLTTLRADCARCVGLCCVVPAFARSADFALDKPAGRPCPNLGADSACTIHDRLRPSGFPGCVVFDCFGAGPVVAAGALGGQDWRASPAAAGAMMTAFPVVRALHELLWYLDAAVARPAAAGLRHDLVTAYDQVEALTRLPAAGLAEVDVDGVRARVAPLLRRVGELVAAGTPGPGRELRGADLVGARLRGADLRGADLRGAVLLGADLRDADLRLADVIGADLRGADLRGADLTDTLYLTGMQLESARGDAATRLGPDLDRPAHWTTPSRPAPVPLPTPSSRPPAPPAGRTTGARGARAGRRPR